MFSRHHRQARRARHLQRHLVAMGYPTPEAWFEAWRAAKRDALSNAKLASPGMPGPGLDPGAGLDPEAHEPFGPYGPYPYGPYGADWHQRAAHHRHLRDRWRALRAYDRLWHWHHHHDHAFNWRRRFRHSLGARLTLVFLVLAGIGGGFVHWALQQGLAWGWMLGGVLLLTVTAYASTRLMLMPLRVLAHGVAAFGRGELSHRVHLRHADEIGALAARFNRMADDIQAMLDAKRELLLSISHELRSPLTRARLNVELLDESPGQQAVVKELGQMRDMIESLLERERLDAGHSALRLEGCTWPELVDELVQRRFTEPLKAGLLTVDIAPELPAMRLDRSRIQVLLGNLLDNALRHNDEAHGPVQLAIAQVPDQTGQGGGAVVRLCVRDRGTGVPDDVLGQLGQPFFRPDSARTRHSGGVGLGLNLCRLIAAAHGGVLHLRNAQPGLAAQVDLPLSPPA